MMSISVGVEMRGSDVGATSAAASEVEACVITDAPRGAVSAAEIDFDGVGGGGFEDVFLAERLVDVGLRGQPRESCPTALQQGQAVSEPGNEANTLTRSTSKKV